jgi:hypothetical protein
LYFALRHIAAQARSPYARLHDTALIVGRDEDERAVEAMRELLDVGFENISLMQAGLPG